MRGKGCALVDDDQDDGDDDQDDGDDDQEEDDVDVDDDQDDGDDDEEEEDVHLLIEQLTDPQAEGFRLHISSYSLQCKVISFFCIYVYVCVFSALGVPVCAPKMQEGLSLFCSQPPTFFLFHFFCIYICLFGALGVPVCAPKMQEGLSRRNLFSVLLPALVKPLPLWLMHIAHGSNLALVLTSFGSRANLSPLHEI